MKKFSIECNGKKIGESDLEHADPTMGMHFGMFYPSEEYSAFQGLFRNAYENKNWDSFNFKILSNMTNNEISYNFVWIQDIPEIPDEIEITVNVKSNKEIDDLK